MLFRADVVREFPMHYDDSHGDHLMWLEILKECRERCAIKEPLLKYRISNTGKSGNKLNSTKMTYMTHGYRGFVFLCSVLYFISLLSRECGIISSGF